MILVCPICILNQSVNGKHSNENLIPPRHPLSARVQRVSMNRADTSQEGAAEVLHWQPFVWLCSNSILRGYEKKMERFYPSISYRFGTRWLASYSEIVE